MNSSPPRKAAGVDGLIVVDLPPEEDDELCIPALKAGLNFIRLTTPTTDDRRLPAVLENTSGFVYYVTMTGITGAAIKSRAAVGDAVDAHQEPYRPARRRRLRHQDRRGRRGNGQHADGIVVGSVLVNAVGNSLDDGKATDKTVPAVRDLVAASRRGQARPGLSRKPSPTGRGRCGRLTDRRTPPA